MSQPQLVVGISLKSYFSAAETRAWLDRVLELAGRHPALTSGLVDVFVLPGFLAIPEAVVRAGGSPMHVGAQNVHWEEGPFTGEVSVRQLCDAGVQIVEVGHAERRQLFGETDLTVALKAEAVLRAGLIPLICVGERERTPAEAARVTCAEQLNAALGPAIAAGLSGRVLVAYEPIWAIGGAKPAPEPHIRTVCASLQARLDELVSAPGSAVIYGGSAGPGLLRRIAPPARGLFLGRFAHDPRAFADVLDDALTIVAPANAGIREREAGFS